MNRASLISLAVALAVAGCAATTPQEKPHKRPKHAKHVQVLIYDSTPRTETTHLDICTDRLPEKPYKAIAILTCEGAAKEEVVMTKAIYYRARQLGPDAVISLNPNETWGVSPVISGFGGGGRCVFRARAIAYEPN